MVTTACGGAQSALFAGGREAEQIVRLFWWMAAGAMFVWVALIALAFIVERVPPEQATGRRIRLLIVGGGVVVPVVVLSGLLAYGLSLMPPLLTAPPEGTLRVHVSGELWWWRVRYLGGEDGPVELANEIRLPVGEPVQFVLESSNVIHAFWIPSLGGKRDLIPGRTTTLTLTPTRTGTYRGACAEYCGTAHALMAFPTVVEERETFDRWLAGQRRPAIPPADPLAARGGALFLRNGCGACHTVRGTPANGGVAPDLTHVASRLSLGAGSLPATPDAFGRWIAHTRDVKPGVLMPPFGMLAADELAALAAYLSQLR